jgi:hypothetical protein
MSPSLHQPAGAHVAVLRERRLEAAVDEALADSFPASDPPAWNQGVARPVPGDAVQNPGVVPRQRDHDAARTGTSGVIDVSRGHGSARTFVQALVSLAGAAGLALLVPVAILLVGLPFVLALRGLVDVFSLLLAAFR